MTVVQRDQETPRVWSDEDALGKFGLCIIPNFPGNE